MRGMNTAGRNCWPKDSPAGPRTQTTAAPRKKRRAIFSPGRSMIAGKPLNKEISTRYGRTFSARGSQKCSRVASATAGCPDAELTTIEPGRQQTIVKTKIDSDKERLVLLRQTQPSIRTSTQAALGVGRHTWASMTKKKRPRRRRSLGPRKERR